MRKASTLSTTWTIRLFSVGCIIFLLNTSAYTQYSQTTKPILVATRCNRPIQLDGRLNEDCWKNAQFADHFIQRELEFGEPITDATEIRILYDKDNLYFGIRCTQKAPITAKYMSPDFDPDGEDNIKIMLSPFNDNRTGYLFVINPNGARSDLLIFGGEDGNKDWNGIWDARTSTTDKGWSAEVIIPFSSLQFKRGKHHEWALNFERDIAALNEIALWTGWSRDNTIYSVVKAGRLTGLEDIAYSKRFEFKPYVLAGRHGDQKNVVSYPLKLGGDLNVSISPTLKLNLTSYTDFAQVESDRIPVNLSRFNVFYPEKRQFFLEGYDLYRFYLGFKNNVFYTRELGFEMGRQVPIVAGARLFGKIGRNNIGLLNIQEGRTPTTLPTNNTVLRYKRDIGAQSQLGGIITNVLNDSISNQIIGLDARYETAEFLGDKNLIISGNIAQTFEHFTPIRNASAFRFIIDYPNDLIDNYIGIGGIQKGFNPALGFLRRTDFQALYWGLRFTPRWLTQYGVQRLLFKPWGFAVYRTWSTGAIESIQNEIRPIGAIFQSGDRFEINLIQNFDRIDQPFELTEEVHIPIGSYKMYQYEIQLESYSARKFWGGIEYKFGDFYTGKLSSLSLSAGWNINKHLNLSLDYQHNDVLLPQGKVTTNEIAFYSNYAFHTRLNTSLFAQYNDLDGVMSYNFRLHWIPVIGSDLFFVYNLGYDKPIRQVEWLRPHNNDTALKLIWRFVF